MYKPPTTFILSYERPIYLWATLDSLYRATKSEMNFVLIDSGSRDPMVHTVIEGFSKRRMFSEVIKLERNDTDWIVPFFSERLRTIGDFFFSVESDVVISPAINCWAQRMLAVMESKPNIAMLGSMIDKSDFIDPHLLQQSLDRKLTLQEQKQIKMKSSERRMPDIGPDDVRSPFNPPGRLLALRTAPIQDHIRSVEQWRDGQMHQTLTKNGWETGIYGGVVHRHLSLCNFFDYSDYSMVDRDRYYGKPT